jgi:hypothetical protein
LSKNSDQITAASFKLTKLPLLLCEDGIGRNWCWRESTDCDILRSGDGGGRFLGIVCESLGGSNDVDDEGEGGGPYAGFFKIPGGVNFRES